MHTGFPLDSLPPALREAPSFAKCPPGCSTHGVCEPISGRCECPLTRTGPTCAQLELPACAIGGQPLAPTFLLHRGWERKLRTEQWVGPLTCECVRQMADLRHLVYFNNPWVAQPRHRIWCATTPAGSDVGALLSAPRNATWRAMTLGMRGASVTSWTSTRPPPVDGLGWFRAWEEQATDPSMPGSMAATVSGLLPLDRCPERCGGRGYCAGRFGAARCTCFAPAERSAEGSCRAPSLPRSQRPPDSRSAYAAELCPGLCSERGTCDREGFCHCPAGYWGLDCGLALSPAGEPFVDRPPVLGAAEGGRRRAADGASARAPLPCVYVYDLPPMLRMGDSFEVTVDYALTTHLLSHPARCADIRRADYWWLMGPSNHAPLVDKLAWAQRAWPFWNASVARGGGARHIAMLLTERGPGDIFANEQLTLATVEAARAGGGGGGGGAGAGAGAAAAGGAGGGALAAGAARGGGAGRRRAGRGLWWLGPAANPASASREWLILTHNGMADLRAAGRNRGRCLICFQPGKDIVIPFPPATIDVPSCDGLRKVSLWSARREGAPPPARDTLFFFAGRMHPSMRHATYLTYYEGPESRHVRADLLQHAHEPGFKVVNSYTPPKNRALLGRRLAAANASAGGRAGRRLAAGGRAGGGRAGGGRAGGWRGGRGAGGAAAGAAAPGPTKVDATEWMQRSHFCWVPPGQRYGDARRHILAVFHGCIPVFTIPDGHHTLEEAIPWARMSVSVSQEQLPLLPAILRNISAAQRDEMRRELACGWRRLWFSSIYGACLGEDPRTDAFDALVQVLGSRLAPAGPAGGPPPSLQRGARRRWPSRAVCGVGGTGAEASQTAGPRGVRRAGGG